MCLGAIVEKPNAYIGMMGSRRRVAIVKEELFEQGHEREKLDEVYTPIGLKIGAETPEEIAVSVMAEIIQVKHEKAEGCGYSKELLEALCDEDCKKQKKGTCNDHFQKRICTERRGNKNADPGGWNTDRHDRRRMRGK